MVNAFPVLLELFSVFCSVCFWLLGDVPEEFKYCDRQ